MKTPKRENHYRKTVAGRVQSSALKALADPTPPLPAGGLSSLPPTEQRQYLDAVTAWIDSTTPGQRRAMSRPPTAEERRRVDRFARSGLLGWIK